MRFRLVQSWNSGGLFKLHAHDTVVSVQRHFENGERIAWTWWDGTECAVLRPQWPDSRLHVVLGNGIACCGQLSNFELRQRLTHDRVPLSHWEFNGQTIVWEGGLLCCKLFPRTHVLRQRDGMRLAFFVPRSEGHRLRSAFAYEGVLRDGLPEGLVLIVFAIILAGIHASLWFATGDGD